MMTTDRTNWSCAETEDRLSDFLEGALATNDVAAFERHCAGCAACAALSARVGATVSELHALPMIEEPPHLVRAILDRTFGARDVIPGAAAVPAREPAEERRGWFDWISALAQPQFAYGVMAVLVSALVVSHALRIDWRAPITADLQPANIYRVANRDGHLAFARGSKYVSDSRIVYEIQSTFETEPASEAEPQPKPAQPSQIPGQSEAAPPNDTHDSSRARRPVNAMRRAASETASFMFDINSRSLL
jgi:hypothetical protein